MIEEMSEHDVQKIVVSLLRKAGVCFFAVPNGGLRTKHTAMKLWQEGVQKGVPDLLILDPPRGTAAQGWVGTAIEIKRAKGGRVSPEQLQWIKAFADRDWKAHIANGLAQLLGLLHQYEYLDDAAIAPWIAACAAGDGSTAPSPTGATPLQTAPAPAAPTAVPRARPKRGRGAAG